MKPKPTALSDDALAHLDAAWAYYAPLPPMPVRHLGAQPDYWVEPGGT